MTDRASPAGATVALVGVGASVGCALGAGLASVIAYLLRCGVFFGEDWSVPDTLSERMCGRVGLVNALLLVSVGSPILGGLFGTARAVVTASWTALRAGLLVGLIAPAAVLLLWAVSGFVSS